MKVTAGTSVAAAEWICSGMVRLGLAILVALSVAGVDTANAASERKRSKARAVPPTLNEPVRPAIARTPRPPWAGPGECYTDEGYGRYWPCGAGKE